MKSTEEILKNKGLFGFEIGHDGGTCWRQFHTNKSPAVIIFSWGGGWDHVSMSFRNRVPTWGEMCWLKDAFFDEDEVVIQFHPAKKNYINTHPYCLHLWRKQGYEIPTPPTLFVGVNL